MKISDDAIIQAMLDACKDVPFSADPTAYNAAVDARLKPTKTVYRVEVRDDAACDTHFFADESSIENCLGYVSYAERFGYSWGITELVVPVDDESTLFLDNPCVRI